MTDKLKPLRTAEGKVVIYEAATGKALERWPVDARGMIAGGDYLEYPPDPSAPQRHPYETHEKAPLPAVAGAGGTVQQMPAVTPIGAPAVHSTAADAGPAVPLGDVPARRSRARRGQG